MPDQLGKLRLLLAGIRDNKFYCRKLAGAGGDVESLEEFFARFPFTLKQELNAPHALADYGFTEESIPEAAAAILPAVPPSNPRQVTEEDLRALLRAAWSGADPATVW